MTKQKRLVVHIDPERCNGCGDCVPSCAEGAIQIIDGKARLIADNLCDGLGACLGHCPQDAIRLEEREADLFDETAVEHHLAGKSAVDAGCPGARAVAPAASCPGMQQEHRRPRALAGCPAVQQDGVQQASDAGVSVNDSKPSMLGNWPIQLHLTNPRAPYLAGASLLIAADCVGFAYPRFHSDLLGDCVTLIGCPKLDDTRAYVEKIADILRHNQIRDIKLAVMEVPCCGGLRRVLQMAQAQAGSEVPVRIVTISRDGQVLA